MRLKGDFHVHTQYCPHGAEDQMESYVLSAINKGLRFLTFTEHAPLPKGFTDPTPDHDSAMRREDVNDYLAEAKRLKEKYQDQITINAGFELDFIIGFEEELLTFIEDIGEAAQYSILSIHMLKAPNGEYVCIDFSAEEFERIIGLFGSVDAVYQTYYDTMAKLVNTNFGDHRPNRIGHLTLIEKFSKRFPPKENYSQKIGMLLETIKAKKFELDANTAGLYKQHCGDCYPNTVIMTKAFEMDIPLVFGSDSHQSNHIARGASELVNLALSLPKYLEEA